MNEQTEPIGLMQPRRLHIVGGLLVAEPELWQPRAELWLRALVARVHRSWHVRDVDGGERLAGQVDTVEPTTLRGWVGSAGALEPLVGQLLVGTLEAAKLPFRGYLGIAWEAAEDRDATELAEQAAERARRGQTGLFVRVPAAAAKGAIPPRLARWEETGEPPQASHRYEGGRSAGRAWEWEFILNSLWASLWTIPRGWTRRQWQLYQQFLQVGPVWTQVAEAAHMSLSAVSHMADRMHVQEWEAGRQAWLRCLESVGRGRLEPDGDRAANSGRKTTL
ncbi:MAG: hypothetical protein IMX01_07720 [Limnochordaceae bacterium]|nr:hypothetical protein [Limnochordaceae bacterium]